MKLAPRDVPGYCARPEPGRAGLLLYGTDPMRIALRRQEVIAALIGPQGEDEMRLTRLQAGDLRKDPARLIDAIKAQSFFPGPRVAFVEDATNAQAQVIGTALKDWQDGDAQIVVTTGGLKPSSPLRKLFEGHGNAYAAGIYDDPPSRAEVEAALAGAGITAVSPEGMNDISALSRAVDPGDFRQTIEKLALYTLGQDAPVGPADIAAVAPVSTEAALDDVLMIVADGRPGEIGPVLRRLQAQGVAPVGLCIGATRHFRQLHAAASHPGGPGKALAWVNFKLRDRMARQAQKWGVARLERALGMLVDTDLQLRSAAQAPQMAVMERTLIRLANMGAR